MMHTTRPAVNIVHTCMLELKLTQKRTLENAHFFTSPKILKMAKNGTFFTPLANFYPIFTPRESPLLKK